MGVSDLVCHFVYEVQMGKGGRRGRKKEGRTVSFGVGCAGHECKNGLLTPKARLAEVNQLRS